MNKIQIERNGDHIINTTPSIKVAMDTTVEVESNEVPNKKNEEDTETSFEFLANQKKIGSKSKGKELEREPELDDILNQKEKEPELHDNNIDFKEVPKESHLPEIEDVLNTSIFSSLMSEDQMRTQKKFYLQQYEKRNQDGKYSPEIYTMENSIDEIKQGVEHVTSLKSAEMSMNWCKQGILFAAEGLVAMNSKYDPFNVDLNSWKIDLYGALMQEDKYDDVLEELLLKYQGKIPMGPEVKIMLMLGGGLVFNIAAQKRNQYNVQRAVEQKKRDDELMAKRVAAEVEKQMGSFIRPPQMPPMQQQQPMHQYFMNPQQQIYQQQFQPPFGSSAPVISPKFKGPTISDDEMRRILESQIIETDSENEGRISRASTRSNVSSTHSVPTEPISGPSTVIPLTPTRGRGRGRGRGGKTRKADKTVETVETAENVIQIQNF